MQVAGVGRVIFWSGGSLWIGTALAPVDVHAHHAIQAAFGLSGPVQFTPGGGAEWSAYPAAVISSGLLHAFKAPGRLVAQLFCEPESFVGRHLSQRFGGSGIASVPAAEAAPIAQSLRDAFDAGASDEDLEQLALDALFSLAGSAPSRSTDRRIARAIAFMQERLAEPLMLEHAASAVGLSPGRFRHLFVAETGIAFRAHLLWARLNRALQLGFGGMPWTEAAQAANFADSAHLSRTCRRMYGLAPTSIRREAPEVIRQLTA
jgi:AraC-like DNA-binding protein